MDKIESLLKEIGSAKAESLSLKKGIAKELHRLLDIKYRGEYNLPNGIVIGMQDCLCDDKSSFDGYLWFKKPSGLSCYEAGEVEHESPYSDDEQMIPAEPEEVLQGIILELGKRLQEATEKVASRNRLIKSLRRG